MDFDHNIDEFLLAALREDIGTGDVTTNSCVPSAAVSTGRFIAKEPGVICGMQVLSRVFELLDMTRVKVVPHVEDGNAVNTGDVMVIIG